MNFKSFKCLLVDERSRHYFHRNLLEKPDPILALSRKIAKGFNATNLTN